MLIYVEQYVMLIYVEHYVMLIYVEQYGRLVHVLLLSSKPFSLFVSISSVKLNIVLPSTRMVKDKCVIP